MTLNFAQFSARSSIPSTSDYGSRNRDKLIRAIKRCKNKQHKCKLSYDIGDVHVHTVPASKQLTTVGDRINSTPSIFNNPMAASFEHFNARNCCNDIWKFPIENSFRMPDFINGSPCINNLSKSPDEKSDRRQLAFLTIKMLLNDSQKYNNSAIVNTTTKDKRRSAKNYPSFYKLPFDISLIYGWLIFCLFVRLNFAQNTGRCYSFGSGSTINGAEYRRDYDIDQKTCSEVCKFDACCMAYEYQNDGGICTLKTRSINGTVVSAQNTVFGLCLDYDAERDRLWDHVIGGNIVATIPQVPKEKCADLCRSANQQNQQPGALDTIKKWKSRLKRLSNGRRQQIFRRNVANEEQEEEPPAVAKPAIMYSWRIDNERDIDISDGTCECISVLRTVRVSFGSFSGFLL